MKRKKPVVMIHPAEKMTLLSALPSRKLPPAVAWTLALALVQPLVKKPCEVLEAYLRLAQNQRQNLRGQQLTVVFHALLCAFRGTAVPAWCQKGLSQVLQERHFESFLQHPVAVRSVGPLLLLVGAVAAESVRRLFPATNSMELALFSESASRTVDSSRGFVGGETPGAGRRRSISLSSS